MLKHKFENLSKNDKTFKITNLITNLIIVFVLIGLMLYFFATNNENNRQFACIGIIACSLIPLVFELISKKGLPNYFYMFLNLYIVIAGVWGSALSGYANFWWLDIVVHTFMGYCAAAVGLYVLCLLKDQKKMSALGVALFCLCFSLFIEGIWELFEFDIDSIFPSMSMQGGDAIGYGFPIVYDTMIDIICNTTGALVFFIQYIVAKFTKRNLGIESMINEFSPKTEDTKEQNKVVVEEIKEE
jgi:hypothetical protein